MTFWDLTARLLIAALCGGLVGIERGKKHRPAGFRTHMLVCIGAALTMALSAYLYQMIGTVWQGRGLSTDVSRFGAQVINGIGFLGAGTIIITGRQQVKGLTTAAGLWASACMGLAIGAGFYLGALFCCILILSTIIVFTKIEQIIRTIGRNINIYVEFENVDDLSAIIQKVKEQGVKVFDVEFSKGKTAEDSFPNAIFSLRLPKRKPHTMVMTAIAEIESVRIIEEL